MYRLSVTHRARKQADEILLAALLTALLFPAALAAQDWRESNRLGEEASERPIDYKDVFATLYHNMGVNIKEMPILDAFGRPNYLLPGHEPIAELI